MALQRIRTISIIIPLYNEEENIPIIYESINRVFSGLPYQHAFVFVNDASTDNSMTVLNSISEKDEHVYVVDLTRNYGKEAALSAGLEYATGDAAILIDADLQHPPKYIPQLIEKWENGAEVVVGVRKNAHNEPWFKVWSSKLFYRLINQISETEITPHATDFRLLDRMVIDTFNFFSERNRITRGLIDWLGYKRELVSYEQAPRKFGQAAYTYSKLFKLATDSIISMSFFPLRLAGYLGMFITLTSGILGFFILVENYILDDPLNLNFSGPAILGVLILFLVGIILVCLGLVALYIAKIHLEVSRRPLYTARLRKKE